MEYPVYLSDDVPFNLFCHDCDCDSPACYDEAVHTGWTQIQLMPENSSENYVGWCPECGAMRNASGWSGGC